MAFSVKGQAVALVLTMSPGGRGWSRSTLGLERISAAVRVELSQPSLALGPFPDKRSSEYL